MKNVFGGIVIGLIVLSGLARSQDLSVTANISSRITGTPDEPTVTVDWSIHCQPTTANTTYGWAGLELENAGYVDENGKIIVMRVSSGALGAEAGATKNSGQTVFKGDIGGAMARVSFHGVFCHDGNRNSPLIEQTSGDILIAPAFKLVYLGDLKAGKQYEIGKPVPVGAVLTPQFQIGYHPGREMAQLRLHFAGADIQCSDQQGYVWGNGECTRILVEEDGGDQMDLTSFKPRKPGRVYLWLEFLPYGVHSAVIYLDVVGPDGKIVPDDFKVPPPKDPPKLPPNAGKPPVTIKPTPKPTPPQ